MTDLAATSQTHRATPPAERAPFVDPLDASTHTRIAIVEAAIEEFRTRAFHETSLETVAARAGLPVSALVEQFGTWDGVVLSAVDVWTRSRTAPLRNVAAEQGTVAYLRHIVQANIADPSLMRFLTAMLNVAALPDHPMGVLLRQDWYRFHRSIEEGLAQDIDTGLEPSTMDPSRGAEQLVALYEGLQLQAMVRPRMDLLAAYDRAVTRLRAGWSNAYVAPVWDLGA